ncbi:hypothetical protein D9M72_465200 [compost metagenome]
MLDGTGDAHGDVQLRRDDLAGLADLHVVRHEAGVDGGTGRAYGGAQLVSQGVEVLEVVAVLHATAAGDDDLGCGQFRTVGLRQLFTDEGGGAGVGDGADGLDSSSAAFSGSGVETGGPHGDHLHRSRGLHGGDGVTGVDRTLEGVGAFNGDDLGDLVDVQQGSDARQVVLAVGGRRRQHVAVALAQLRNQRRDVFRQLMRVGGVVGYQHLGHAGDLGSGFGHGTDALPCHEDDHLATDLLRGGHGVECGGCQRAVVVFSDYQDSHLRSPSLRSSVCRPVQPRT